ncbi:hypothetical protein CRE_27240 [Caenorhabditis remanei]|uniref:Serpentine receptor class gamma n=1 Tax=Caenorhabditis remanei TaxID=31234 RepID=E3LP86_CAERE|nr:hypothetical protein CRE_27240 [Caenorhabditis remanei]
MALWLFHGPFSLVLSLFVFTVLTCNQKFKSLFYRFVQFDIIINIIVYINFASFKLVASGIYVEEILIFMETHTAIRLIRDFICNWSYHIQSSSLLLKCVYRFTLAKYPNGPEVFCFYSFSLPKFLCVQIWKHYFRLILILTLLYSCLAIANNSLLCGFY